MRVLYFSVAPVSFSNEHEGMNGMSWISSLLRVVSGCEGMEIGITYVNDRKEPKVEESKGYVTIIPMNIYRTKMQMRWYDSRSYRWLDKLTISKSVEVVERFRPDVIHVFGSEWCFGLIAQHVKVPVVIHMQGFWPVYRNVNLYNEDNVSGLLKRWLRHPKKLWNDKRVMNLSHERAEREIRIIKGNYFFMGRTEWDHSLIKLLNPRATYFYVAEPLRKVFGDHAGSWRVHGDGVVHLMTVGTSSIKGIDVIFKAAHILQENGSKSFVWHVFGGQPDMGTLKRWTGLSSREVGVVFEGSADAKQLVAALKRADIFVHATYADNSPNCICEAQMIGLPVITTYAGGISSLFNDNYDKDLFAPINDPYYLASKIIELSNDKDRMERLSQMNAETAQLRHDDKKIADSLLSSYKEMVGGRG